MSFAVAGVVAALLGAQHAPHARGGAAVHRLDADPARLNPWGGAIALGHAVGASGTRLMATLVHALHRHGKRYGLQTMCEGGGMANVTIVERLG